MIHVNNVESQLRRMIEQKDKRLMDQDQELLSLESELQETRQDLAAARKKSRKCEHQEVGYSENFVRVYYNVPTLQYRPATKHGLEN